MQDLCVSERARQLRSALEDFTYNDRKLFLRQGFMVYSVLLCKHCYKHYGFQVSNGKKEGKDVSAFFSYQIKSTTKKNGIIKCICYLSPILREKEVE